MINKKFLTIGLVCLFSVLTTTSMASAYSDVSSLDKDYQAIKFVESLGLFEEDVFNPDEIITKGQLFEMLLKADGYDINASNSIELDLKDLSPEYEPYFERMYDLGVFEYSEGQILSNQNTKLKNWNALRYFFRYKGIPVQRVLIDSSYLQSKIDNIYHKSIYAPFVDRGLKLGLIEAENRNFNTFDYFTRRDFAKLMYRYAILDAADSGDKNVVINVEQSNNVNSSLAKVEQFKILEDVWLRANNDFLYSDDIKKDQLLYGAIDGLVEALDDPYTTFQIPTETADLQDSLSDSYEGIGASLHFEDGRVVVVAPIADSPAEKVGLQSGDIIVGVDGARVTGERLDEVIKKIKGEAGTSVNITISRNGIEKTYSIVRAKVSVKYVTAEQTLDNILILKINTFGSGTSKTIESILNSLNKSELNGIIIDLRNNPGGYVNEAVDVADVFLGKNADVVQVNYKNKSSQTLKTSKDASVNRLPIGILINKGSASASEILAGALDFHLDAVIVGENSFGKGTVQELISYSDKSSLKLTTAEWMVPSRVGYKSINKIGIKPDFEVTISKEDIEAGNDSQLNKAIFEVRN